MDRFGAQLTAYCRAKGLSLRALDRLVSTGNAYVAQVASGASSPPLDQIPRWADELGLNADQKRDFLLAAALEHAPEAIRTEFLRLRATVARLEAIEAKRRNQEQQHQQRTGPGHYGEPTPPPRPMLADPTQPRSPC